MKKLLRRLLCAAICTGLLTSWCAAGTRLPILMYHKLTTDAAEINSMTLTDTRFRCDMEFLQQFGYTPVLPRDLIEIKNGVRDMPENPVMITFDDGYRSNYTLAYPVLQQTGMKAAIAVVGSYIRPDDTTEENRPTMTWGELREMSDAGVVEVGSHTFDLHNPTAAGELISGGPNGIQRQKGETQQAYQNRVGSDLRKAADQIKAQIGRPCDYFAYPYGAYDAWMAPLLCDMGISVTTMSNAGLADISKGLHKLPRYRITMDQPLSALLRQKNTAFPVETKVSVNGAEALLPSYRIGGYSYVRVRDVALLLRGTGSEFAVDWNADRHMVRLASHAGYTPRGDECAALPAKRCSVQSLIEPTSINGAEHMLAAYNIDRSTFFKLRSLSALCDFTVDWDNDSQTIKITA